MGTGLPAIACTYFANWNGCILQPVSGAQTATACNDERLCGIHVHVVEDSPIIEHDVVVVDVYNCMLAGHGPTHPFHLIDTRQPSTSTPTTTLSSSTQDGHLQVLAIKLNNPTLLDNHKVWETLPLSSLPCLPFDPHDSAQVAATDRRAYHPIEHALIKRPPTVELLNRIKGL